MLSEILVSDQGRPVKELAGNEAAGATIMCAAVH
jgi:hypothetical protein